MRKLAGAINMTLDGVFDHTAGISDDQIHEHYNDLLRSATTLLYGRITYQLMESYWPAVVEQPTGNPALDSFAVLINDIEKIVFSNSLKEVSWKNSILADKDLATFVTALKQQPGGDIFAGSRSLIISLLNLGLLDEFQVCIQPVIAGRGMRLFDNIIERIPLKLIKTKTLERSGSVVFYYLPAKQ